MSYYGNFDGLMNMNVSYDWSSWGSVPSVPPPVIPSAPSAPSAPAPSVPSAPYVSSEPAPSQQAPSQQTPYVSSAPVIPQGGTRVSIPTQIDLPRYSNDELKTLDDKIFGKTAESLVANDLPSNSLSSDSSVSIFSSQGVKTIAIQNSTPLMAGGGLMAGLAFAAESKLLGVLAASFFGLGVAGLVMLGQAVEETESLP